MLELPQKHSENSQSSLVRVPYAEKEGRLVHVSTVERGLQCAAVCPVCKTPVVARKGEKTRHHFAHYPGANCNPETVLHYIAKRLIHEKLTAALVHQQAMPINWKCTACSHRHHLNLLEKATQVAIEKKIEDSRPDISLLDSNHRPRVLIEIVVSHPPDHKIINYCNRENIPLVIFHITGAKTLEKIGLYRNLNPTTVFYCLRDRCSHCNSPLFEKRLYVISGSCWRCGAPMQIAVMQVNHKVYGISHFSAHDQEIAREKGVIFREYFNKKSRQREIAATCRHCGMVTGNQYIGLLKRRLTKQAGSFRGKICLNCRTHFDAT